MLKAKVSNWQVIVSFWRAVRHYRLALFLVAATIIGAVSADIAVPLYYKRFFDILTSAGDRAAVSRELISILFFILFLYGLMWLGYRIASFANSYFQSYVMSKLREQSFEYLLNHSYEFFSSSFVGSLVQKINRYVRAFERVSDRVTWDLFPMLVKIIGVTVALWLQNKALTYIMLAWVGSFVIFNVIFSRWKLKYDIKKAAADSRTTAALADAITNQNTIQIFTGFKSESENFRKVSHAQRDITFLSWNLAMAAEAVQAGLIIAAEFFLFYFSVGRWAAGELSVGVFVLFQLYLGSLIWQMWHFGRIIRDLYESFADAREMAEILYLPHGVRDIPGAGRLKVGRGQIELQKIEFKFHHTRTILHDLNFIIRPGEKVALIGPSGAGKSTIIKLLFRFYDTSAGQILIDGQNIAEVTQESLRQNLSLVPQDPILFHRTLLENIRYGQRGATEEEVLAVAALAHCDEFAKELPAGYATYVGERGIKLSGGERQRVAIARAMLKNAPILVLDEATSSLDSHSESLIQDALDKLMAGKTTIVIAHRLSTIRKMDRILVLDKGRIVEEGGHDDLLKRDSSIYKKLWTLQAGGFIK